MRAKDREHVAKNRTHADDIHRRTWPTTVEQWTTADNLTSMSITFQQMMSTLACKYDGLAFSSPQILTYPLQSCLRLLAVVLINAHTHRLISACTPKQPICQI